MSTFSKFKNVSRHLHEAAPGLTAAPSSVQDERSYEHKGWKSFGGDLDSEREFPLQQATAETRET